MTDKELFNRCVDVAARTFNISHDAIVSRSRRKEIVDIRRIIACYMNKFPFEHGSSVIGRFFNKDHTTILNYLSTGEVFYKIDATYKSNYDLFNVNMETYNA